MATVVFLMLGQDVWLPDNCLVSDTISAIEVHSFRVHCDVNSTPVVNSTPDSCSKRWFKLKTWVRIFRPEGLVFEDPDAVPSVTVF